MKKLKTIYWIITGLFIAAMLTSTVPSVTMMSYSVEHFTKHLGFPAYFLFFTGLTKSLGIIALLIPGYPTIKEWVYAGFTFDLIGAIYCTLAVGDPVTAILFQLIALTFMTASYIYFRKVWKLSTYVHD